MDDADITPDLEGVAETLLIPLWARAVETRRPDGLVRDTHAVRILGALAYDFGRLEGAWKTQVGVAIRTWLIDRVVAGYLADHPGGTVVILGSGLDARSSRLDNGTAHWVDLDLPEVVALRRRLLSPPSPRHRIVAASALDPAWLDAVPAAEPPLIVAEGLFMYLPEEDLRRLWRAMAERLSGALVVVETISPWLAGRTERHDALGSFSARFRSGMAGGRALAAWHPASRLVADWSYFAFHRRRWRWLALLSWLPVLDRMSRLSVLRFA